VSHHARDFEVDLALLGLIAVRWLCWGVFLAELCVGAGDLFVELVLPLLGEDCLLSSLSS
jgi:hypothetical protein